MSSFHSFEFYTERVEENILTHVFLDNKELHGVTAADISYGINQLPVVKLEFIAKNVSGNLVKVEVKDDGENGQLHQT